MKSIPSAEQIALFDGRSVERPVVLFYQYTPRLGGDEETCKTTLARLGSRHAGRLLWAADQEQAFVGAVGDYAHACQFHFASRSDARRFFQDAEHARALGTLSAVQVAVLSAQPRAVVLLSALLAKVLPWLPFNNAIDPGEEPGVDTSGVMPTSAAIAKLKAHPEQDTPVVMINWLKFRHEANYATPTQGVSGKTAYYRYGKVALLATHSLKAKLIFASRYQQMLIGNGGDPAPDLWDEFALMQYPGRATFMLMASLKRYRRALHHREAGLTESGQGLTITRPHAEFVWRA